MVQTFSKGDDLIQISNNLMRLVLVLYLLSDDETEAQSTEICPVSWSW